MYFSHFYGTYNEHKRSFMLYTYPSGVHQVCVCMCVLGLEQKEENVEGVINDSFFSLSLFLYSFV